MVRTGVRVHRVGVVLEYRHLEAPLVNLEHHHVIVLLVILEDDVLLVPHQYHLVELDHLHPFVTPSAGGHRHATHERNLELVFIGHVWLIASILVFLYA